MEQKNKGSCITFWMRGRRSAQPAPWTSKTWCLTTKEQGLAGGAAPRQVRRRRHGRQRRGARRRKNKGLRGAEHHATAAEPRPAGGPESPNHWRGHGAESHAGSASPRAGGPPKKDRRTVGPPNFPNLPNLLNLSGVPKYSARPSIGFTQVAPTSPSGFSWSSSWIAASSGFWHVPARSGRSAAGPWNRTGSNNSCC